MAVQTQPIDPARFAQALEDLPLESLHAKAAELRNSINHLKSSNEQMLPFAEDGDDDCREAMFENLTVIGRINERIRLLKEEVERRGMRWGESDVEDAEAAKVNGHVNGDGEAVVVGRVNGPANAHATRPAQSGSLTDDELRRRLEAQMGDDGEDEGVHL